MKKSTQYILYTIIPIISLAILFFLYLKFICLLSKKLIDANLICELNWKDGFILVCSYSVIKIISPALGFHTVIKRLLIILLLYCVSYAIIAFPYWLTSLIQPFQTNVFIHTFLLICLIEFIFSKVQKKEFKTPGGNISN